MEFSICGILEDLSIQVSLKEKRIKGTLHEDQYTFFIISRSFLLRMKNVPNKRCRENQNTHFLFGNCFSKILPFMRKSGKILYGGAGHR